MVLGLVVEAEEVGWDERWEGCMVFAKGGGWCIDYGKCDECRKISLHVVWPNQLLASELGVGGFELHSELPGPNLK